MPVALTNVPHLLGLVAVESDSPGRASRQLHMVFSALIVSSSSPSRARIGAAVEHRHEKAAHLAIPGINLVQAVKWQKAPDRAFNTRLKTRPTPCSDKAPALEVMEMKS